MKSRRRKLALTLVLAIIGSLFGGTSALAEDVAVDGAFLPRASFTGNYDIAYAQMGFYPNIQSGELTVDVPASATGVVAAYLWWSGRIFDTFGAPPDSGDDTVDITINGGATQTITATDTFYSDAANPFVHYNYFYDLTGQIGVGSTTVLLEGFDLQYDVLPSNRHNGFGVAVVYEDPTVPERTIEMRDGNDRGYWEWPAPAGVDSSVQCFDVPVSPVDQVYDVTVNITAVDSNDSVNLPRPQTLWWLTGTGTQPAGDDANLTGIKVGDLKIENPVEPGPNNTDPYGWVWYPWDVTVPAGDEWVCMQLESVDDFEDQIGATTGWSALSFGAPTLYRLGNLVWIDGNGNGSADIGEPGIAGVTVELYDASDTLIDTTTTDTDGKYEFSGLPANDYYVLIPAGQDGPGGPLEGLQSSTIDVSDPNTDADNDDNGLDDAAGVRSGIVSVGDTVGPNLADDASNEPNDEVLRSGDATDDDPDDTVYEDVRSNFTVDFGFLGEIPPQPSIGNLVWNDLNDNGVVDAGEPVFEGVTVNLWTADAEGNPLDLVQTTVTDADGHYGFLVDEGDYIIQIPPEMFAPGGPLDGFRSSTPTFDPANGTDNDDNGDDNPDLGVVTSSISVTIGGAPTGESDDDPFGVADQDSNLTIDLGLYEETVLARIGNFVWFDERTPVLDDGGNLVSGPGNNVQDPGEPGISGVTVRLYDENNTVVAETATDADGLYLFSDLAPGDYWLEFEWDPSTQIDPNDLANPEFYDPTLPLLLVTKDIGTDDEIDSDGDPVKEAEGDPTRLARTEMTTLDPDETDLSWDLGLTRPTAVSPEAIGIGNLVWWDINVNGVWDQNINGTGDDEPVFGNVTVEVWQSDAVGNIIGTDPLAITETDSDGHYWAAIDEFAAFVRVRIAPENFAQGGPLARDSADLLFYSTPGSTGDTQVDHDDNGVDVASPRNGGVWSVPIELVVNGEPTGEGDPLPTTSDWDLIGDDDSDFTVDFGFVGCDGLLRNHPVTGELCWNDTGHESGEQAGYGLMLLGLGMLMVLGVEDWTRRRLLV